MSEPQLKGPRTPPRTRVLKGPPLPPSLAPTTTYLLYSQALRPLDPVADPSSPYKSPSRLSRTGLSSLPPASPSRPSSALLPTPIITLPHPHLQRPRTSTSHSACVSIIHENVQPVLLPRSRGPTAHSRPHSHSFRGRCPHSFRGRKARVSVLTRRRAHALYSHSHSNPCSVLRPVIRRLNDTERSAFIRSGSVFVWEESEEAIGLRRVSGSQFHSRRCRVYHAHRLPVACYHLQWTDGLMVSVVCWRGCGESLTDVYPSSGPPPGCANRFSSTSQRGAGGPRLARVQGEESIALSRRTYHLSSAFHIHSTPNERLSSDTQYSTSSGDTTSPRSSLEQTIPGLVKQTYSAIIMGDGTRRKWHMTAYFTNADYPSLPTIQDDPRLRAIVVPRGMYRSGKSRQSAKSLQSEWAGANPSDLSTLQTGQSQSDMRPSTASSSGYETPSPTGSPTMEYRLRRTPPPSPYSRPPSSHRANTYPMPTGPPSRSPTAYRPMQSAPGVLPPSLQAAYPPHPPVHGSAILPPLQSTYSDQRYVLPAVQRSLSRTAEDERVLRMFRPIP